VAPQASVISTRPSPAGQASRCCQPRRCEPPQALRGLFGLAPKMTHAAASTPRRREMARRLIRSQL
jgi:hypothetical protein